MLRHAFVTRQGPLQPVQTGPRRRNFMVAWTHAAELPKLSLADALSLVLLARDELRRFERAVVRCTPCYALRSGSRLAEPQLVRRAGSLVGLPLRHVAGPFGSPRALMGVVKLTASRTTALVTPAHAQGHDGNYSQDNQGNHDHNDSCLDGHRNHQGLALLLCLPKATSRPQDTCVPCAGHRAGDVPEPRRSGFRDGVPPNGPGLSDALLVGAPVGQMLAPTS